jgi:hypothetical protein
LQTNATAGTIADKIDLSQLDPTHTFTFATTIAASGHGEVSAHLDAATNDVVVLVDATGDGIVDMEIELQNQHALTTAIANALKADIIIYSPFKGRRPAWGRAPGWPPRRPMFGNVQGQAWL